MAFKHLKCFYYDSYDKVLNDLQFSRSIEVVLMKSTWPFDVSHIIRSLPFVIEVGKSDAH